jgi:hypothetical protein
MVLNTEIQFLLINFMLVVGVLVFLLGLWILILPSHFLKVGQSLSKWVTTDEYFNYLDKPHYQERLIYKYHRLAGGLIILGALYTLGILILKVDIGSISRLPVVISSFWSDWLYGTVYYLLIGANILAVAAGIIVFARPSMLKGIEQSLNKWVTTGQNLKKLDETHEISLEILPGNPRLFGLAVALGGLYISMSMGVMLL